MLRADPGQMSDLIFSTGQMSDLWVDSNGSQGARAHLPDRLHHRFEIAGGKSCTVHRRNCVPGILGEILQPHDPRWVSLERVWLSKDEVFTPPSSSSDEVIRTDTFIVHMFPSLPVLRLGMDTLVDTTTAPDINAATDSYL